MLFVLRVSAATGSVRGGGRGAGEEGRGGRGAGEEEGELERRGRDWELDVMVGVAEVSGLSSVEK